MGLGSARGVRHLGAGAREGWGWGTPGRTCPSALLILWLPVKASSSRLSQIWAPPTVSVSRLAWYSGVGRPM
jgi:hypothetical protein